MSGLLAAAAAVSVCAIGVASWMAVHHRAEKYVTDFGEQRTLQLEDGSTVHLNARSRLEVRFTARERELRLTAGEALFKVARDGQRPFRVQADEAVIQALGTQFNVHRRPSGTVVSVLEGAVRVSDQTLGAGDEVRITSEGAPVARRGVADARTVTAWRQHRLVFQDDTLADIAAEFNRYNALPQIRIEDDAARARHFAGTFDADAPQALIEALQTDSALIIRQTREEIAIRSR